MATSLERALSLIADVPDYPKPGILFKDITPLLADGEGFSIVIDELARKISAITPKVEAIVGIESRGFILGGALAKALELVSSLLESQESYPEMFIVRITNSNMALTPWKCIRI